MQALHAQAERPRGMESQFPSEDDVLQVDETQWRRYGRVKRKELLENDRRKGGNKFNLNYSCSVHRYFQVAHRALEQFHNMYRSEADVEETYIMGHRMISFLTECLPKHPDFRTPEVAELRVHSRQELELLERCLDDVALRIDEDQCNRFVADFDPIVDDDSDSDDDSVQKTSENWVAFGGWTEEELKAQPRKADSPTSDTVTTTGTGSVDAFDISSSDESGDAERLIDFSDYEETSPKRVFTMEFGTAFLERIAKEDVRYETDSDAADSWAQDHDSIAPSASSASGIICDPARLAFRELLNRVPRVSLVKESPKRCTKRPDPPAAKHLDERAVETEIQKYLESEDEDPSNVIDSFMEKLKMSSPSKSPARDETSQSSSSSGFSSAFSAFDGAEKEKEPKPFQSQFVLEGDEKWVSFDSGQKPLDFWKDP